MALALAGVVGIIYLFVEVGRGSSSAWILMAVPAPLFIVLFFGSAGCGMAYLAATGRRPEWADRVNSIFVRLNSNL